MLTITRPLIAMTAVVLLSCATSAAEKDAAGLKVDPRFPDYTPAVKDLALRELG